MLKTETYQRRINAILSDKEFKEKGISCIVSPAGFNGEDQMFNYMWYFTCDGERLGMPDRVVKALDIKELNIMAREVGQHQQDYKKMYGKKKGFLGGLFS